MARRRQPPLIDPTNLPAERPGRAGGVRDLNRRDNLRRLCDAGLVLFLAEGITTVTIEQIVVEAGMAKGSFYRYVADKTELVAQIIAPVASEVTGALDRCERALRDAAPRAIATIYLTLATELAAILANHAPRVLLYLQEARAPAGGARRAIHALADELTTRTIALTRIARANGLIRDVDPRVSALTVLGAVDALLFAQLRGRGVPIREVPAVTSELVSIVLRGIRA
jgi:AcrR family transcriptional regulator